MLSVPAKGWDADAVPAPSIPTRGAMSRSRLRGRCSPEPVHTKKSPSDEPCLPGPQREGLGQSHKYHSEIRGNLLPFLVTSDFFCNVEVVFPALCLRSFLVT